MFQVIKLRLWVLNVQVLHHEVRLVKMWKTCVELVMRSMCIWWCWQHSRHII